MDDFIKRQDAIDEIREAENHAFNGFYKGLVKAHKIIASLPSAQRKGKWIWKDREVNRYRKETGTTEYGEVITIMVHDNYLQKINYCPVCGKRGDDTFMNYCPNCGARMEGSEDE